MRSKLTVELRITPGAVHAAEVTPLQFHAQFIIAGKLILGLAHLIMEETDSGQLGLDGAGLLIFVLLISHIAGQMLTADIA